MSEQQERAIDAAHALTAGLETVGTEVASLRADMETDRSASEARDAENARHSRRNGKWIAFDILVTILLAVFGYLSVHATKSAEEANSAQQRGSLSSCRFFADLAGLPVTVNPATGKASLLGVKIVSDSRTAWHGIGCPGSLAPPSASFTQWAHFYHLSK